MKGKSGFQRKTAAQQVAEIENKRLQRLLAQSACISTMILN